MAAILSQLRRLHGDLSALVDRDPEQEVQGIALPLIDAVVSEARELLPEGSTLASQVVELVSPNAIDDGNPIRAADALVVVGQLLAVYEHAEAQKPNARIASAARLRLNEPRRRPTF